MFADDKSIENFQQLFFEFKKYLELQKEYTKLELTEKLTILFSTLIMILVLIILGMVALFYLLFCSCLYIGAFSGRPDVEFRHHCRHQCCSHRPGYYFPQAAHHSPMVNFLANLFLTDSNK